MFKEIKYLIFIIIIFVFIFFTGKYYFSDMNKKNSYRSLNDIEKRISLTTLNIPILSNDTQDIIEYNKNLEINKKKYRFWELIIKNE
tara:strand:+ start:756 stop:1016 length:261 start_codon:yes stop_codon:yes gene_type:complete